MACIVSIDLTLSYNIAAYFPPKYYQNTIIVLHFCPFQMQIFREVGAFQGWLFVTVSHGVCIHCVHVCVCVFSSTVKASAWTKTINVMPGIRPAMLRWGNYSVSSSLLHCRIIDNHNRDIQASNCARVSIKPGTAIRNKIQLLELSKNQW